MGWLSTVLFAVLTFLFGGRSGLSLTLAGGSGTVVEAVEVLCPGVNKEAFALDVDLLPIADISHVCP